MPGGRYPWAVRAGGPLLGPKDAAFLPSDIPNGLFWFDADDAGTITETLGEVSGWTDKFGTGRDLGQITSGKQPNIDVINGNNSIFFDGGEVLLVEGLADFSVSPCTGFQVITPTDITANRYSVAVKNLAAAFGFYFQQRSDDMQATHIVSAGDNMIALIVDDLVLNTGHSSVGRSQDGGPGDILDDLGNSFEDVVVGTLNSPMNNIYVGAHSATPSSPFIGHVHEMALYNRFVTDEERTQLLDYATTKWGL